MREDIGAGAPVFLASVLEYLAKELLLCSGDIAKSEKCDKIKGKHIEMAVLLDDEWAKLFGKY